MLQMEVYLNVQATVNKTQSDRHKRVLRTQRWALYEPCSL